MGKYTMANGKAAAKMVVACGKALMDNPISVNGKMVKSKVLEFMSWKMDHGTKDNSKTH